MFKKLLIALILVSLIYLPLSTLSSSTSTLTKNVSASSTRPLKYYMVDRVLNNADFAELSSWGINTAVVDFDINGKVADWQSVFTSAAKYNINIVVWPSDYTNPRPNCDWEAPFPVSATGDITKVKPLIDAIAQYPNFIGMVNGHESFWSCKNMTFDEMAGLKTQLKAYALSKGRSILIWNYINSLYWESMLPAVQIPRIMDVAVTWLHCAGNAEGTCADALSQITSDRARITAAGLDGQVQLVYLMDTFTTSSPYTAKFTLTQLETYSCQFLNSNALDGFSFYTWDAGWWPDLHGWTDLQPAIPYISQNCSTGSALPTSTVSQPTATTTSTPTMTASPTPTMTGSPTPTLAYSPTPVNTLTAAPTQTLAPTLLPTNTYTPTNIPLNTPTPVALLPAVILISPANNASLTTRRPVFSWNRIAAATKYTIQLSQNASFTSPQSVTLTQLKYLPAANLARRTYYWRVRANNGIWSPVWTFTIK